MSAGIETRWADLWSSRWKDGAYRLRFELGGDYDPHERPIPRALQAFTRAEAVAGALFGDACIGVVATYGAADELPPHHGSPRHISENLLSKDGFAVLRAMGFRGLVQSSWTAALYDNEDDNAWLLRSFDLAGSRGDRNTLLWSPVVLELPIWPSSPDRTFLLHPTEAILLHVYDDRGMDVIGGDPRALRPIYEKFDGWLLDYDRPRIEQVFA
jgi:Domain of unknown function (DUF3885)